MSRKTQVDTKFFFCGFPSEPVECISTVRERRVLSSLQVDKHGCTPLYSAAMAINPSPKVAGLLVGAVWKHAGEETLMNSEVYRY